MSTPPGDIQFTQDKVNEYPHGYPRLAAFINSDAEGHIYRRFSYLRSRLLLYYQDKICQLEERLATLDKEHEKSDPIRLNSRRYDEGEGVESERKELMRDIDENLKSYDELLLRENDILRIAETPKSLHRQYFNWIYNEKPLIKAEYSFIYRENDFISLGMAEDGWVAPFVKDVGRMMPKWLLNLIFGVRGCDQSGSEEYFVYSDAKTQKLVKAAIGVAATLMLLLPVIIFYILAKYRVSYGGRIGVLCGFILTFNLSLLTMTTITKQELFGVSAGYAAVLVVFLGSLPVR